MNQLGNFDGGDDCTPVGKLEKFECEEIMSTKKVVGSYKKPCFSEENRDSEGTEIRVDVRMSMTTIRTCPYSGAFACRPIVLIVNHTE